ncbi:MAG: fatty acid desaturase [Candidatus Tectimicrobiota bacterium]
MQTASGAFVYSSSPEPHRQRTKDILKAHPEIRQYMGHNPMTLGLILAVAALQMTLALGLTSQPWWLQLLLAYTVGAVATHALAIMIHECAHNLVLRGRTGNYLAGMLANLPMVIPSSVSFKRYHLKHHAFQGVYDLDADLPSYWEIKLVGRSALGKALWLFFIPFFHITRPLRIRAIRLFDRWTVLNIVVVLGFDLAVYLLAGWQPFVYLGLSLLFAMGFHPLGARWIQEHYLVQAPQETYSYYGPFNWVTLNVGYHNEHHDFPSIPWNSLPKIRRTAAPWYTSLAFHTSLTGLLWRFLTDPSLSLTSRMVRHERGGLPLSEEFQPDVELAQEV